MRAIAALLLVACVAHADMYLHWPRGSNDRLNEQSANRNNGNRLFDSQNNNRGGYNVGDKNDQAATADNGPDTTFNAGTLNSGQYQFLLYEGSQINIEWTNQHGCGGNEQTDPQQLNCNIVGQIMCETDATVTDLTQSVLLRDGTTTNTPTEPGSYSGTNPAADTTTGLHESPAYYYDCKTRPRNRGLFLADQNLGGNEARFTRQNPNGNRNGYECPEERDYWPYWQPSPWMDMFVQTDEVARCQYYRDNSQNVMTKWKCNLPSNPGAVSDNMLRAQDQTACNAAGGVWSSFTHGVAAPQCEQVDWSRVNHLGNGRNGQALSKNISLPTFATLPAYIARRGAMQLARCVYRQRYNMSTDDYDPWNTNSSRNDDPQRGIVSPVRNNPTVDVGADLQGLKLAINTNQFGRTFQDRSHVFYIKPRPTSWATKTILNLGVRGKRCNIVQCYPAVEYDFHPNRFHIPADEIASTLVHVQWTGSNTHNNGDPAGDGQAGNAGEGTEGTDRNNIALTKGQDENFPIPLDKFPTNMWTNTRCYQPQQDGPASPGGILGGANNGLDCAITMATSGYHRSVAAVDGTLNVLLNNAPASLVGGIVWEYIAAGPQDGYTYINTRNNNFSNRSQKGVIVVGFPAT